MDWDKVTTELQAPLSPDAVKPPPQGKFGEYVEALHVIREANRIFGFDGWSYATKSLQLTNSTMNGEQHRIGYLAIVQVTVDGVTREDVGHGQGFGKSEGDSHDSAVKEAVTDGMKRALRTFGNTFGLALYEKNKNAREVGFVATDEDVNEAIGWIENCADLKCLQEMWANLYRTRRHVADNAAIVLAKDKRKAELTQPDNSDLGGDSIPYEGKA